MLTLFDNMTLLKSSCVLCDKFVTHPVSICKDCYADLPRIKHACSLCAIPLNSNHNTEICGQCLSEKRFVDYAESLFYYENPIDYLISQMKFQHQLPAAAVLADLLKNHIEKNCLEGDLPDAILPIPLHKKRLAKRGFNQSLEIVKPFAKSKNIPIIFNLVERSKATQTQTHLNKQQRKKNVAACFRLLNQLKYKHIVIVDDVVTTGATTNELAKLLKKSGVEKVGVWSLARAELS